MDSFAIPATDRSPEVSFDFPHHRLSLKGESYPEDVARFYGPVLSALEAYLAELKAGDCCRFEFRLVYFNSSSAKAIMTIMEKLDEAAAEGADVRVSWYYDPADDTMQELGEEFGEDLQHAVFALETLTD